MKQKTEIEAYSFGKITVNGKSYSNDIIVFPAKISSGWWREAGHSLSMKDLSEVLEFGPDCLIVGTGHSGAMDVPQSTAEQLKAEGIELIARPTTEAVKIFNEKNSRNENIAGAFHLTC